MFVTEDGKEVTVSKVSDADWKFILNQNKPNEQLKDIDTRTISKKKYIREIAYHEASHLVFSELIYKLIDDENFQTGESIWVNINNSSQVKGYGIKLGKYMDTQEEIDEYYKEHPNLIFPSTFISLAGYSSFKYFFDKDEIYFIASSNWVNNHQLKYYRLNFWMFPRISDFKKASNKLQLINIYSYPKKEQIFSSIIDDIVEIMSIKIVNETISYIKNKLIQAEREQRKIESWEFQLLKFRVQRLLKSVSITSYIEKYDKLYLQ
ncbi:MAG: hypothetical protein ACPG19_01390 [Saprospiraceae bacterium]